MSAAGQIKELVEGLLAPFRDRETRQNDRLDELEARVTRLEGAAPAAKAAPRAVKARAGVAEAKGEARST